VKKKHFIFIIQNNNKNRKHIKINNKKVKSLKRKLKNEPSFKKSGDFTVAEGHGHPLVLHIKVTVSVCVGSAWKILPVTAHSPEITHLNTLNKAFLTVSVFGHLEFACTGGVQQNLNMEFLRT
jgi:hypothetical protein